MKGTTSKALWPLSFLIVATVFLSACRTHVALTKAELQDKIKGGWAGQVIGCTYGGPTEFHFKGQMIPEDHAFLWDNERCLWYYENFPGLYDDVYMDLTFVDVFEKEGLDAPASSHALAFAHADYPLWHANQAARYNILNGRMPPDSGYWVYNPHSEDIDFQIEADFAGLMSPGMVNTASEICDRVGHIMNYGDGWYGGVYVAAMYSLAFVSNDVPFVVNEALKVIPEGSTFHQCMSDVIAWHSAYPDDWTQTWEKCQKKWSLERGCPEGVFQDYDIDAKLNAAYVLIGLLYGEGDFGKTINVSARCGQDSDCNPATAAGILGTMIGYDAIPDYWKAPLAPVENLDFQYTTLSLNDVYQIGYRHALENLERNGASVEGESIEIPVQQIKPVRLEAGFENHYPKSIASIDKQLDEAQSAIDLKVGGVGFAITGRAAKEDKNAPNYVFDMELYLDGDRVESFAMPTSTLERRLDVAWKYQLSEGTHTITLKLLNPKEGYHVKLDNLISYTSSLE